MVDRNSARSVIDSFGEADRQARLWTPPVNPYAAERARLLAIIEGWHAASQPEFCGTEDGRRYRLSISACQYKRDLTPEVQEMAFESMKSLKALRNKAFNPFTVFATTQEAIRRYLGEAFLDKIAPKKREGKRTYTVVALSEAVKLKAA